MIGYLNRSQFMLQWIIRFPEFAKTAKLKVLLHLGKIPISPSPPLNYSFVAAKSTLFGLKHLRVRPWDGLPKWSVTPVYIVLKVSNRFHDQNVSWQWGWAFGTLCDSLVVVDGASGPCRVQGSEPMVGGVMPRVLYSEVQCILGNGQMGTPHGQNNWMMDRYITIVQSIFAH